MFEAKVEGGLGLDLGLDFRFGFGYGLGMAPWKSGVRGEWF